MAMTSARRTQIHKLIMAYEERRDESSRTSLQSAIENIPPGEVVEVLSYGYYGGIFAKIGHYIKILFARLFRRYKSDQRRTVIHYAVQKEHIEVIELILETNIPDDTYSLLKKQTHWNQCTAVHYAAEKDFSSILHLMRTSLQSDRKWRDIISIPDHNGRTAVHAAAVKSQANAIDGMLSGLKRKCEVLKIQDKKGNTALHLAAEAADSDTICELTLDLDETEMYDLLRIPNKGFLNTPIHLIAEYGTATELSNLIKQVGDAQVVKVLMIVNEKGNTAEKIAVHRKDRTLLRVIQNRLRNANTRNSPGSGAGPAPGPRPGPGSGPCPGPGSGLVAIEMLPSSVAQPTISSRDNSQRYPVTSAIVENKVEITGINHQSNHSGNIPREDTTESGGNSYPEEETQVEDHIHQADSIV